MNKIGVVIVDDHPTVRMGIEKLLENQEDIEVRGEAGSINEAIGLIGRELPDVALVDLSLDEEMGGIDLIKAVSRRYPEVKILVHSMFDEKIYAERAIRAGAKGYLQKNEAPNSIVSGIRKVVKGELILSEAIKDRIIMKLMHSPPDESPADDMAVLTNREFEVFQLFGQGYTIREIAGKLNLSQNTIETHRRNIREKLNIGSNNQLIRAAVEWVSHNRV